MASPRSITLPDGGGRVGGAGFRHRCRRPAMAELWRRSGRTAFFGRRADHPAERGSSVAGMDLSHRRATAGRSQGFELRGHADPRGRQAARLYADRSGICGRPVDRTGDLDVRPETRGRPQTGQRFPVPRRRPVARCGGGTGGGLRRPRGAGHTRLAGDRTRSRHRPPVHRVWRARNHSAVARSAAPLARRGGVRFTARSRRRHARPRLCGRGHD